MSNKGLHRQAACLPYPQDAGKGIGFGEFIGIGSWSGAEKDLVTEAYAYMQQNVDIVQWACCVVFGPDSSICDCISDYVNDVGTDIDMRVGSDDECDPGEAAFSFADRNNLYLCGCLLDTYSAAFDSGGAHDQKCAAMSVAVVMAHELGHMCGWEEDFAPSGCDSIFDYQNLIEQGLEARCGADAECIDPWVC